MKKLLFTSLACVAFSFNIAFAQEAKYTPYYYQKASLFEKLPINKKDVVFLGNSITDGGEWSEIFNNSKIKNRGISGDIVQGVYDRLDPILCGKPSKIFLMIGINDVSHNVTADSIVRGISKIYDKIASKSPNTKVYVQSVLPVNPEFGKFLGATTKSDEVVKINTGLKTMCKNQGITFIDVYSSLTEKGGNKLDKRYTNDGLHLLGEGYFVWKSVLESYINN